MNEKIVLLNAANPEAAEVKQIVLQGFAEIEYEMLCGAIERLGLKDFFLLERDQDEVYIRICLEENK